MWDWQIIVLVATGFVGLVASPWAIVAWIVRRIVRGDLVARSVLEDRMRDKDRTISALDDTLSERDRQIAILLGKPVS